MANFLSTKIALRTDTIQNWNSLSNQVLLNGEVAIVMTDEKLPLFKIGDGVRKFCELPYSNSKISSDMVNAIDIIAKSICQGANSSAVPQSLAAGLMVSSDVPYSQAFGYNTKTKSGDVYSFTWSGETSRDINKPYTSHAIGSFNINPNNGLSGFYIGDRNLKDIFESEISGVSKVALISNDIAYSKDLSVVKITGEEYYKLVADERTNPSALYVVDDLHLNAYDQTIRNVASPELSDDAANKNYVDSEIAKTKDYVDSEISNTKDYVDSEISKIPQPKWGSIEGNIEDQTDLVGKLNEKAGKSQVDAIEEKIPAAADSSNQLADKAFVNSSINNYAAFYLTKNANGDAFGTYAELTSATKFWNAGVEKTPTKNDYLVVLQDETKTTALGVDPTTRYTYQGEWPTGQFEFQYIVNNSALTQAQVDAINSGITKSIVDNRVIPSSTKPGYAANAVNSDTATTANTALSATYAPDYTPLSTFNETLGDLSSIIHEI